MTMGELIDEYLAAKDPPPTADGLAGDLDAYGRLALALHRAGPVSHRGVLYRPTPLTAGRRFSVVRLCEYRDAAGVPVPG